MKYYPKRDTFDPPVSAAELMRSLKRLEQQDLEYPIDIEEQDKALGKFWDAEIKTWAIDDDFS